MMSISNRGSAAEAESYYEHLAEEDNYYINGEEEPGRWHGNGLEELGIEPNSAVTSEEFSNLLRGYSPDGEALVQNPGDKHRAGWDLTFSAPKSVSVMWAMADSEAQQRIQEAHEKAVSAALNHIESELLVSRRGQGGSEKEQAQKAIIAKFNHDSSRDQDPQLHTHSFLMNLAQRPDGTWGSLETKDIYKNKMAMGAIYQAELAHQMRDLGFQVEPDKSGTIRLTDMPKEAEREFSRRRQEIEAKLAEKGMAGAKASEMAALDTRSAKEQVSREELFSDWHSRGEEIGFGSQQAQDLLWNQQQQEPAEITTKDILDRLTQNESVFNERDLLRTIAITVQEHGGGYDKIQKLREELTNSQEIVRLKDRQGNIVLTSREMLNLEKEMLGKAETLNQNEAHKLTAENIDKQLHAFQSAKGFELSPEQVNALKHITLNTGAFAQIAGAAGAGKTVSLEVAANAWKQAGMEIRGAALAGKAASGLQEAGDGLIQSQTVHSLLLEIDNGKTQLKPNTVLIVDETGMLGSRQMSRLIEECDKAGSKLVLVGDAVQLQAIDAGGAHRALQERMGAAEVVEHRRQKVDWQNQASSDIRNGNTAAALAAYAENDCVHQGQDRDETVSKMVDDWAKSWEQVEDKQVFIKETLMLASTRAEVAQLNTLAREKMIESGLVDSNSIEIQTDNGKVELAAGDRVLFTKNDKILDVKNGQLGFVKSANKTVFGKTEIKVEMDDGREVSFSDDEYNDLQHGLGVTTHKSQGVTVDRTFVLSGSRMTDLQMTYVQLTRHRYESNIYVDKRSMERNIEEQLSILEPSDKMINYVEDIANKQDIALPHGYETDFIACRDFLNEHSNKYIDMPDDQRQEAKLQDDLKWLSVAMSKDNVKQTTLDYQIIEEPTKQKQPEMEM